jgi:LysR family hydrogen peroxide-inducible transcriptional activator
MVSLRQLRYLESLAETRHFGHAAESCAVSQPALSMQIKELEDELQVSLVERRMSGVELTEQGEEIARRARTILASVRDLLDYAKHQEGGAEARRHPLDRALSPAVGAARAATALSRA